MTEEERLRAAMTDLAHWVETSLDADDGARERQYISEHVAAELFALAEDAPLPYRPF